MLATHDSLTAYPVKSWWFGPFNFLCKCQDKTLEEQYHAGARSFDLRFARYRGEWHAAHGAMIYRITLKEALKTLAALPSPVYFRVLCEDTFYRKSCAGELARELVREINLQDTGSVRLKPLYVRSKRTWDLAAEFKYGKECASFDTDPLTENDRDSLCAKVARMYELQTPDDRLNFIGCYESGGIPALSGLPYPRLAAKALTPIALKKKWKENDVPVVDFL
ncbi:MAG: hypothetical protein LBK22_04310 [Tannerella sp.]|jgi:hypothetical protein|nr:hypothetical protein [Tannerella sp.]